MTSIGGAEMVDWNLAVATATRLVRPGPEVSRDEARAVVTELRRHAKAAEEHVRAYTGMYGPGGAPEQDNGTPVLVVDRIGWIKANGDLQLGHLRFTVGAQSVTRCLDVRETVHALLAACGGDVDSVAPHGIMLSRGQSGPTPSRSCP